MVSTRSGAGVSKPKTSPKESVEKLKDAANGDLPPAKARVANEQAIVRDATTEGERGADQEHSVETQSKPEFDAMEGISHEPVGEPQADSNLQDASGSGSSRPTNDASPTASRSDTSMSEPSDSDQESELLADFESLSLKSGPSGVVDGFGGKGRSAFCILRDGPRNAPIYHFTRTNGFNTQGFKNLSYHRITLLDYENEKEEKNWVYTKENVQGIVGIAIEVRPDTREYKRSPQAWVKIRWKNIKLEHKTLLIKLDPDDVSKRHSSWIPKSDLVRLVGRKAAESKISEAWDKQEEKHLKSLGNKGQMVDRSPTPCPLDAFVAKREQREGSQGLSPPYRMTPRQIEPLNRAGPKNVGIQPQETVTKEEPEGDTNLFVPPASLVTQSPPSNTAGQENEQKQAQGPLQFNYDSFLEGVKRREKWHRLSEEDQERRLAEAEVRYDRYREMRLRKGDIEVDDE